MRVQLHITQPILAKKSDNNHLLFNVLGKLTVYGASGVGETYLPIARSKFRLV